MEGDPLGIVQEIEIWPYKQVVYAQPRIHCGEWDAQSSLGFWDIDGSPDLRQMTITSDSKKERTSWIVDFAISVDRRVKLKESEKRDST